MHILDEVYVFGMDDMSCALQQQACESVKGSGMGWWNSLHGYFCIFG